MPVPPVEPLDIEVGDQHRFLVERLALQPQPQNFSHRAAATVTPDEVISSYGFARRKLCFYSLFLLAEGDDRCVELNAAT